MCNLEVTMAIFFNAKQKWKQTKPSISLQPTCFPYNRLFSASVPNTFAHRHPAAGFPSPLPSSSHSLPGFHPTELKERLELEIWCQIPSSIPAHLWCDCLKHKKIGTEEATHNSVSWTAVTGYCITNVFLSIISTAPQNTYALGHAYGMYSQLAKLSYTLQQTWVLS